MTVKKCIKTVAPMIQTRSLIPKDQYKGPILKLTNNDKIKIQELLKQQAEIENEINKLYRIREKLKKTSETHYYDCKIFTLDGYIECIKDAIKKIKVDRLNEQKRTQNLNFDINV